eukprot:141663_1
MMIKKKHHQMKKNIWWYNYDIKSTTKWYYNHRYNNWCIKFTIDTNDIGSLPPYGYEPHYEPPSPPPYDPNAAATPDPNAETTKANENIIMMEIIDENED